MPQLRRKQQTAEKELEAARWQALMAERTEVLQQSLENFLGRLRHSAQCLSVPERQKVVRLLIKEIIVEVDNRITIRHCLPLMGGVRNAIGPNTDCYPLCTGRVDAALYGSQDGRRYTHAHHGKHMQRGADSAARSPC